MNCFKLSHLAVQTLLNNLATLVTQDRATTAALLAHIAEVDERKLYLPAAQSSMYSYCVRELGMSEDVAYKRITAARVARRFPAIFSALADGELHLSAVVMLAPHLTPDTAASLLAGATHKTRAEIELLIAERFPRPDVPTIVQAMVSAIAADEPTLGRVDEPALQLAPGELSHRISQLEPSRWCHFRSRLPRGPGSPRSPQGDSSGT